MKKYLLLIMGFMITSCMPAVKPELIDKMNVIVKNSIKNKTYRAGGVYKRVRSLSLGQFTLHKTVYKGKLSLTKLSIVKRTRKGWVFESYSIDGHKEAYSQFLYEGIDKAMRTGDTSSMHLAWIKFKNEDGTITTLEGEQLAFGNAGMHFMWDNDVVTLSKKKRGGKIKVPAGTFRYTTRQKIKVKILFRSHISTNWYNSFVPISGVVKTVSEDGNSVVELIDFGLYGAKAQMFK